MKKKRYNELVFVGTHNSFAFAPHFKDCVANQHLNIAQQLDAGVRMLDFEIHVDNILERTLTVCHGTSLFSCYTGKISLLALLEQVKTWHEQNPETLLTLYMNMEGILDQFSWANAAIIQHFVDAQLIDQVFSFNDQRTENDPWPLVETMLEQKRTIMVFGLNGKCDFKKNENYFVQVPEEWIEDEENCQVNPAWRAENITDLLPEKMVLPFPSISRKWISSTCPEVKHHFQNKIFCLNVFASPRTWSDRPFLFGGNPHTAARVNTQCPVPLMKSLVSKFSVFPNWVWVDFFDPKTCAGLLEIARCWSSQPTSGVYIMPPPFLKNVEPEDDEEDFVCIDE
jgi:hypothetical protein